MSAIRIVTDSSCDLPQDLVDQHGITIVPLTIRFGGEEFVDRTELSVADFWRKCATFPGLPETAAPSPGAFEEAFRAAAAAGADGVVCINLSGELSATIQSARIAAGALAETIPVKVIDSASVSMGLGLMVIAAAEAAAAGKSLDDVAGVAEDLIPRTEVIAALDTLENLKKGGRIGAAQAMIGSLLSFKPIIQIKGTVQPVARQRTRARALAYLLDQVKQAGRVEDLTVVHAQAPDIEAFLDLLSPVYPREKITVAELGPVVATHGGTGVTAVVFHTTA